ncbi:MAG: peptide methionine sulfoxide reductase MsrA [Cognaticolwellia sp.]
MIQTRAGYAGGLKDQPTYKTIGDHAEALRVVYDPERTSYVQLLKHLARWHTPRRTLGQYRSIVFVLEGEQAAVQRYLDTLGEVHPEIIAEGADSGRFWDAEDYHQKYRLRRDSAAMEKLRARYGEAWDRSELATKLNARGVEGFEAGEWEEALG